MGSGRVSSSNASKGARCCSEYFAPPGSSAGSETFGGHSCRIASYRGRWFCSLPIADPQAAGCAGLRHPVRPFADGSRTAQRGWSPLRFAGGALDLSRRFPSGQCNDWRSCMDHRLDERNDRPSRRRCGPYVAAASFRNVAGRPSRRTERSAHPSAESACRQLLRALHRHLEHAGGSDRSLVAARCCGSFAGMRLQRRKGEAAGVYSRTTAPITSSRSNTNRTSAP